MDNIKGLAIPEPHGFLVWKGKQKSVGCPFRLQPGEYIIISGGEAYGTATIAHPSIMVRDEFDRLAEEHKITAEERKMFWPDDIQLFVHPIARWVPFPDPRPVTCEIESGVVDAVEFKQYKPTGRERELLEQAAKLPKQIVLSNKAVCLSGSRVDRRMSGDAIKVCPELEGVDLKPKLGRALKAVFEMDDYATANEGNSIPLYSLALVRLPRLEVERGEVQEVKAKTEPKERLRLECTVLDRKEDIYRYGILPGTRKAHDPFELGSETYAIIGAFKADFDLEPGDTIKVEVDGLDITEFEGDTVRLEVVNPTFSLEQEWR